MMPKDQRTSLRRRSIGSGAGSNLYGIGYFPETETLPTLDTGHLKRRLLNHETMNRHFLRIVAVIALLLIWPSPRPLLSQTQPSPGSASPPATTNSKKPAQTKSDCTNNGTYRNSQGQTVQRPENCSSAPAGATAQCRDGTYSFSKSRRGTCSHHGGVAKWL